MKALHRMIKRNGIVIWYAILGLITPEHMKRLMFLASVHLRLKKENILQDATLKKLNSKMQLATDDQSLKFGEYIVSRVLTQPEVYEFINENRDSLCSEGSCPTPEVVDKTADTFIGHVPSWMHYDDRRMRHDIMLMITPSTAEVNRLKV